MLFALKTSKIRLKAMGASMLLAAVVSCHKGQDKTPAPGQEEVDTWVTGSSDEAGRSIVRYESNVSGARFKCLIEKAGRMGPWQDCPGGAIEIMTDPGVPYVLHVKAIAPDGREDLKPVRHEIGGPGGGAKLGDFMVQILNKSELPEDGRFGGRKLTMQFGITGTTLGLADFSFQCKREGEVVFGTCTGSASYEFSQLRDGADYSLAVRAVHTASGQISREDHVNFSVQIAPLTVHGAEQLVSGNGLVALSFDPKQIDGKAVSCTLDGEAPVACNHGYVVDMSKLPEGSHSLYVEARDQRGLVAGSDVLNFCVGACSSPDIPEADGGRFESLLLGASYEFLVPPAMHVTEYATLNTYNNQLSFLRVLDDPNYLGNYACRDIVDRVVQLDGFQYCHSTPTRDLFKWLMDSRIAFNHIEVATTSPSSRNHQRVMMNLFDEHGEFVQGRSRFDQLCSSVRGHVKRSPMIPIAKNFWGEEVYSAVFTCQVYLPRGFGGGTTSRHEDYWWVGGVFITTEGTDLPTLDCLNNDWQADLTANNRSLTYDPRGCGNYRNPQLLEIVFMNQGLALPEHEFVRLMQTVVQDTVEQVVPRR